MADKAQQARYGKMSKGEVIAALMLCGAVYFGVLLFKLVEGIERQAFVPGSGEETGLFTFDFLFSLLIVFASTLICYLLRSRGVSYRVVFYAIIPVLGIFPYQIYSRSRLLVLSYLASKCREGRGETEDISLPIVCSNGLNLTWEDLKPFSGLGGDYQDVLVGLIVIQAFFLLFFLLCFAAAVDIYKRSLQAPDISLQALAVDGKSKPPFKGATVADLNLKSVVTVQASTTTGAVIDLLDETGLDQIVVVSGKSETLVGLVTHKSLVTYILRGRGTADTPVSQVVTDVSRQSSVVTPSVTVNTPLTDLHRLFQQNIACVVTESTSEGVKVAHVVSKLDLLGYLAEQFLDGDTDAEVNSEGPSLVEV